jgi:hypothetical protein
MELGLSVGSEVEFDPNFQPEPSREERDDPPQTVGSFRQSVLTEDERSLKSDSAWTVGDEPVRNMDEAAAKTADPDVDGGVVGVHRS